MAPASGIVLLRESSRKPRAVDRSPTSVTPRTGLPTAVEPAIETALPEKQVVVPNDGVDTDARVERDLPAAVVLQLVAITVRGSVRRWPVPGANVVSGSAVAEPGRNNVYTSAEQSDCAQQNEGGNEPPHRNQAMHRNLRWPIGIEPADLGFIGLAVRAAM